MVGLAALKASKKVHNSSFAVKVELRRLVLAAVGKENATVLDLFCGKGEMYKAVWKTAAGYVGCDAEDHRGDFPLEVPIFVCDNLRLARAIDLSRFNIFDVDAFGSPWDVVWLVANRMKVSSPVGVVITDGDHLKFRTGSGIPSGLAEILGIGPGVRGAWHQRERLVALGLKAMASAMGGHTSSVWVTTSGQQRHMVYAAAVITPGIPDAGTHQ